MMAVLETDRTIDAFLGAHPDIAAMPENTAHLLRMTRDVNCNTSELLKLVEQDAALSARILKAVNSSFYALATKMTRLDRAIAFMGLGAVKEIALSCSMSKLCKDVELGPYRSRDLWDHSVAVAILCRELAVQSTTIDPEDAFLAGMLHDVGLLLGAQCEREKYRDIIRKAECGPALFMGLEQAVLGFSHCELGERVSQKWKFPDFVSAVVRFHHEPQNAPDEWRMFCRHVYIADTQCAESPVGFPLTCSTQQITEQDLQTANISQEALAEVTAKLPMLLRLHLN